MGAEPVGHDAVTDRPEAAPGAPTGTDVGVVRIGQLAEFCSTLQEFGGMERREVMDAFCLVDDDRICSTDRADVDVGHKRYNRIVRDVGDGRGVRRYEAGLFGDFAQEGAGRVFGGLDAAGQEAADVIGVIGFGGGPDAPIGADQNHADLAAAAVTSDVAGTGVVHGRAQRVDGRRHQQSPRRGVGLALKVGSTGTGTRAVVVGSRSREPAHIVSVQLPGLCTLFQIVGKTLKGTIAVGRLRFNRLTHVPEFGDEVAFEAEHVEHRVARLSRCMDDV